MYSLVEKSQILSNPMPLHLHSSPYGLTQLSNTDKHEWAEYFVDLVNDISGFIAHFYPSNYEGSICLAPPCEKDARALIKIFELNCQTSQILEAQPINFKQKTN